MSNVGLRLASSQSSRTAAVLRVKSRWGTRNIHRPRGLLYPVENGLGEFLPPAALKSLSVDYQSGLLQRLNDEVRGTEDQNKTVVQTVLDAAPIREKTLVFNYASLALNNSFFLDHLKPPPAPPAANHQAEIGPQLAEAIRSQHGSMAQLKSSVSAAAMGMFTSGYIWFVTDKAGNTGVIPTFGPGSLLIRSRSYMAHSQGLLLGEDLMQYDRGNPYILKPGEEVDSFDLADEEGSELTQRQPPQRSATAQSSPPGVSPSSPASGISGSSTPPAPTNSLHPKFLHTTARASYALDGTATSMWTERDPSLVDRSQPSSKVEMLNIGETIYPLFCVSVFEHAWMSAGYGVWGKEEWLKKFWTVVDWGKVSQTYNYWVVDRTSF